MPRGDRPELVRRAIASISTIDVRTLVQDYALLTVGGLTMALAFNLFLAPSQVAPGGVTAWSGRGMFTERERTILFCTVSRPDVSSLKWVVAEVDPNAFVVIGEGHQVRGGKLGKPEEL